MNTETTEKKPTTISGRLVIVAMFLMGLTGGALCVAFAIWHNAPYLELKKALLAEYPKSTPQVEGGSHKGSPTMLRIILHVDFHPGLDENSPRVDATVERIIELAQQHQDLKPYETLRIHLVKKRPQDMTSRKTVDFKVADLEQPDSKPSRE